MSVSIERASVLQATLNLAPPRIRQALVEDKAFRDTYGITADAVLALGEYDIRVYRSELFAAIRYLLDSGENRHLRDLDGGAWTLSNDAGEGEHPSLVLSSDERSMRLPDFAVLSDDHEVRLQALEDVASAVNLPTETTRVWRDKLSARTLDDEEVDQLHGDIRDTPIHVKGVIRNEIVKGQSTVSSLIPSSRRYFDRLIGEYDNSQTIGEYAIGPARKLFRELADGDGYEGLLSILLIAAHSRLSDEISVDHLSQEQFVEALKYLHDNGDPISRVGALEVGLRVLPVWPEVETCLLSLVRQIRDDDAEDATSHIKLFSWLFVLVDGELARTGLMARASPFYRRLASLAQAGLIHREIIRHPIEFDEINEWAANIRGEHYYMQTFADMRLEPRWNPDFVSPPQMKAEYIGRILIAGNRFRDHIRDSELNEIVLGNGDQSLYMACEFPRPFFPGPMEGAQDIVNDLPDELSREIENELDTEEVEASSFVALVNAATVFRVRSDHADLAANALRLGNYTITNLKDKAQLVNILSGLATVAAISRSADLSDELRILARRYRQDTEYGFSIDEDMKMCLVAAAAHDDLSEWRSFAGDWLTELAFGELNDDEAAVLHSHLRALLNSVPELWFSCAKADAALRSFRFR